MTAKRTKSKSNTESLAEGQGVGRRKAPRPVERRTSEGSPKGEAEDAGVTAGRDRQRTTAPKTYTRDIDGATMVEVAPHQFVNASLSIVSKRKAGEE